MADLIPRIVEGPSPVGVPSLFGQITMTLKCIGTNEGGTFYPDNLVILNRKPIYENTHGYLIEYCKSLGGAIISFAGVKNNDVIGTLKRGHLEVLPHIGFTITGIIPTPQVPNLYTEIPMTGLYIDANKVDIQCSQPVELDGIIHTKTTSMFEGSKVETIRDGVCRLCHQKTNHPRGECPSRDLCVEPNRNSGPCRRIPVECKENAIENGLRFDRAPESTDEAELQAKFGEYGDVKKLVLLRDRRTGLSDCCGAVFFVNIDDAERALNALKDQYRMYWFV